MKAPFLMSSIKRAQLTVTQAAEVLEHLDVCWQILHQAEMSPDYLCHFGEAYDLLEEAGADNVEYEIATLWRILDERYTNNHARRALAKSHSG